MLGTFYYGSVPHCYEIGSLTDPGAHWFAKPGWSVSSGDLQSSP